MHFTEDMFEQAVIELFENMGYTHIYAPDMDRDYSSPLLDAVLQDSLVKLNKGLPLDAINEAISKLRNFDTGSLLQKNMQFMDYLQNGIPVRYFVKGEERTSIIYLIDYKTVANNSFYVVNQFTYIENGNNRRPDIILFINGLPLVLMELKSPSKDEVNAENAYNQIRNYMQDIPSIFNYNAICVISDLTTNKAGTITSGLDRFMEWKTKDGSYENTAYAQFDTFYEGMFDKARLLDIIKNFICFSVEQAKAFKILAGYHQYFAVRKAIEKAKIATKTDGKGGVFWHTQGSGKSLSMATMYVYKPMHGYNLMQAIARVNRVFKDKEGGLVVDYVGIAGALKAAMKEYTARDRSKYGDMDIAKTAYPKFQEKLQVCRDLFHGFDYSSFIGGSPLIMAKLIADGANFVLDPKSQERKDLFLKEALLTKQAISLCSSMTTENERHEAAYFEAVRSTVIKLTYGGNGGKPLSLKEINAQINELLKASIQSEGVISLFDSRKVGENFSLFDPAVLEEISNMKQKNIAVEILKKLLAEQVSLYKRTNLVQSVKFSEMITRIMNAYYNGHISNDEVIKELLEAAELIAKAHQAGDALGLTQEELAFYDALTKPQAIKDFYENDVLVQMTRELTEMLRKNRTIDWQQKETARATMRKMVKRLLKKYKYPPEQYEDAIDTVISQCEMWTDNYDK